ncbi:MAG: DUF5320 domain-containing protein [Spirochaetota bacterium]
MPAGDRTGPMGLGPMTGRAAGYCAGYSVPGYMNPIPGRFWYGRGYGRAPMMYGGGRGWRNWYYATGLPGWARAGYGMPAYGGGAHPGVWNPYVGSPYYHEPTPEEEMDMLQKEYDYLKSQLEEIQSRIETLKKAGEQGKKK